MKISHWIWIAAALAATEVCPRALAEESQRPRFLYDLTLWDAPFNSTVGKPWQNPSMSQSLNLSRTLYHGIHAGLQNYLEPNGQGFWFPLASRAALVFLDAQLLTLPGFSGWAHEEWHRAVMSHRGVDSYDEIMDWPNTETSGGVISVSHESDEDLTRMKRESNADFVRLQAAGWEAEWELNRQMRKDSFFAGTATWNVGTMWLNLLNNSNYLSTCASGGSDVWVRTLSKAEATSVSARDFTGPDCTGWTYDLHRPNEAYTARGEHPSGVGVNRYRLSSDLSGKEKVYLKQQAAMAYINYFDPMLFGFREFKGTSPFSGAPMRWNVHLQHTLTSFGGDTALGGFYSESTFNIDLLLHVYKNQKSYFPGIDIEMPRQNFSNAGSSWSLVPKAMVWMQPKNLEFATTSPRAGGLASLKTTYRALAGVEPYFEVAAKSQGWVAGVVDQEASWFLRTGLTGQL
jgi:hypothetical protein